MYIDDFSGLATKSFMQISAWVVDNFDTNQGIAHSTLAGVVYSFVLGSSHTAHVGEETSSESKTRGRRKNI